MKFSTVFILPLAAVASAQVSPCPLSYSSSTTHTHNEPLANNILPNSHRALHQNKVRDHQTALRQHPRQREQGVPRPSRRAGCSQARGRARAQARGHRVCQAKGGPAGRGEREQERVVALDRRAVSPRARAVGRFRVGVTVATTGARRRRRAAQRRRAAAAARRPAVASGPRGLGRPLVGRAACRRLRRLRRRWCLMPGPVRGPVPGLLAVAGWCLSLALGLRLCCLCEGHMRLSRDSCDFGAMGVTNYEIPEHMNESQFVEQLRVNWCAQICSDLTYQIAFPC